MPKLESKVLELYKNKGFTHRESVRDLALICANGIAATGEKGFSVSSDSIEVLITIKIKVDKNE